MKQLVSNACGTVALIHCIANNKERWVQTYLNSDNFNVMITVCFRLEIKDCRFKELLEESSNISPQERGELLQSEAGQVLSAHQELAMEGQTEVIFFKYFVLYMDVLLPFIVAKS